MKQLKFFKPNEKAYGGSLMKKRKGRGARPLVTQETMHLVLRSVLATGNWSFHKHHWKIWAILDKFAKKYGVTIYSWANGGNHIHIQLKLSNRFTYRPFIRAVTAAIAMKVTGMSRWNKLKIKFWERRPFTRIVIGRSAFLKLKDYLFVNSMEGQGYARDYARLVVEEFRRRESSA